MFDAWRMTALNRSYHKQETAQSSDHNSYPWKLRFRSCGLTKCTTRTRSETAKTHLTAGFQRWDQPFFRGAAILMYRNFLQQSLKTCQQHPPMAAANGDESWLMAARPPPVSVLNSSLTSGSGHESLPHDLSLLVPQIVTDFLAPTSITTLFTIYHAMCWVQGSFWAKPRWSCNWQQADFEGQAGILYSSTCSSKQLQTKGSLWTKRFVGAILSKISSCQKHHHTSSEHSLQYDLPPCRVFSISY